LFNPSKTNMETKTWGAAILGALIAGLGVATFFLHQSNNRLEQTIREKETAYYTLVTKVQDLEAEGERLKTEPLAK
jgi:uncharacterized protein HemX